MFMALKNMYPVRYVARQTGLTPHLIRSWERRYAALTPMRTGTNHRRYSDDDIKRLLLLRDAVEAGNSIGQIASLGTDELQKLNLRQARIPAVLNPDMEPATGTTLAQKHYASCLSAITRFEPVALEKELNKAAVNLNKYALLNEVIIPLIQQIGELWSEGEIKIYHEHAACSVLRTFLGDLLSFANVPSGAPTLLVATPAGQHHELGALIAAVAAASAGWRVTYIGADLPYEEIAGAALQFNPKAVCLSIVFPPDDPKLVYEIRRLRRVLPPQTRLIIGGRAATAYYQHIDAEVAEFFRTIPDLLAALSSSRESA
jgi:MerR family transcriptional regulator, light-induced transcriptional regulator